MPKHEDEFEKLKQVTSTQLESLHSYKLNKTTAGGLKTYKVSAKKVHWAKDPQVCPNDYYISGDIYLDQLEKERQLVWDPTFLHPLRRIPGKEIEREVNKVALRGLVLYFPKFSYPDFSRGIEEKLQAQEKPMEATEIEFFFKMLYNHYQKFRHPN
jgi:hypothetical protein